MRVGLLVMLFACADKNRVDETRWPYYTERLPAPGDAQPTAPDEHASLLIDADPHGLVSVDGVMHGKTPAPVRVKSGHHVIEVVHYPGGDPPGHAIRKTLEVDVGPGENRVLRVDFRAEMKAIAAPEERVEYPER